MLLPVDISVLLVFKNFKTQSLQVFSPAVSNQHRLRYIVHATTTATAEVVVHTAAVGAAAAAVTVSVNDVAAKTAVIGRVIVKAVVRDAGGEGSWQRH